MVAADAGQIMLRPELGITAAPVTGQGHVHSVATERLATGVNSSETPWHSSSAYAESEMLNIRCYAIFSVQASIRPTHAYIRRWIAINCLTTSRKGH